MVYPDIKCWDNEGDIDSDCFNTNTGVLPTAIKAMINRVTGETEDIDDEESSSTIEGESESEETTEEESESEEGEGSG